MKKLCIIILALVALLVVLACYRVGNRCGYIIGERWDVPSDTFIWIDDDGHPDGMCRVMSLCNKYNIRCTFAIVGKEIAANKAFYDSCRMAGHKLVSHSYAHSKSLNPDNELYSPDSLLIDMAMSKKAFASLSTDNEIYVYPGNCGKDFTSRSIAASQYKYCFGGRFLPIDYLIYPRRHYIPRYSLNKHTPIADFKAHVDRCRKMGIPIVISTHSYNDDEWEDDYISECLSYLLKVGD